MSTPGRAAILGAEPAFPQTVPITQPTMPDYAALEDGFREVVTSGMLTNGRWVRELEDAARQSLGVEHAVALSSCTAGLMLSWRALGVEPGGAIMIHGLPNDVPRDFVGHPAIDWTNGCIAVTNREIDEIWALVEDGTEINIYP